MLELMYGTPWVILAWMTLNILISSCAVGYYVEHVVRDLSDFFDTIKMLITGLIINIQTCFWCQNVRNNNTHLIYVNFVGSLLIVSSQSRNKCNNVQINGFVFTGDVVLNCQ